MAVKGKKLKQRIGRWQEYVDQPPTLPARVGDPEQASQMFEWSASPSGTSSELYDGADGNGASMEYRGFQSNSHSTSLQTNADAAADRRRLEAYERLLDDLQIQLQDERARAEQLQTQLAREVMRARQVRTEQRPRTAIGRFDVGQRLVNLRRKSRSLTGTRNTTGHYTNAVTTSRINSVKWILMVAVAAGIWGLLVSFVGNSFLP